MINNLTILRIEQRLVRAAHGDHQQRDCGACLRLAAMLEKWLAEHETGATS